MPPKEQHHLPAHRITQLEIWACPKPVGSTDADDLKLLRHQHPAWKLLAARRAPVIIACLRHLFSGAGTDVAEEDACEILTQLYADNINNPDFSINATDLGREARRDLREHIRSGLLTERSGLLSPHRLPVPSFAFRRDPR